MVTVAALATLAIGELVFWGSERRRAALHGRVFQRWSRALCRLFGVSVRVVGEPPRPPFFLVSNHVSYVDIIALGAAVPCVFVAKGEIDRWPFFGRMCRSVDTIFIDRQSKRDLPRALAALRRAIDRGKGVVVFAEGTSGPGDEVLPFRSSFLELPIQLELPVHYAALSYDTGPQGPPARLSVCWWGEMPFSPHVREFLKLDRVEATVAFGPAPHRENDRKLLAERLEEAVADLLARTRASHERPPGE